MINMRSFTDEVVKISSVVSGAGRVADFLRHSALPAAQQHAGSIGLLGLGAGGFYGAQRMGQNISFAEKARSRGVPVGSY